MAKGEVAGSLIAGGGGFRVWPALALRRKLLEAVICGGGSISRHHTDFESPPAPADSKRSDRLGELLRAEADASSTPSEEESAERKVEFLEELQRVTKKLQVEDSRKEGAMEVRRLAKENAEARQTLAMLGAIPPLVGSIDSVDPDLQLESLYALLNLAIGNDANKGAIVKAGSVHRMLSVIESGCSRPVSEAIVANFLGLTALDYNKPVIGASGAVPFLVNAFRDAEPNKSQARLDSLRSIFNLSISPLNVSHLVESELVSSLFAVMGDMEVSEMALSVLSNLVASPEGRRTVSRSPGAIRTLVDVLDWCDSPGCQEKAAYVVMIMAYKAYSDRAAMVEAGIVSSLLELTLMGSALAQKRASRILEILRVDRGKEISEGFEGYCNGASSASLPVSAPLCLGGTQEGEEEEAEMGISEERKAVKELVQQSLVSNMRRMVRRANLPQDFVPSERFVAVTGSSATSKSLPF